MTPKASAITGIVLAGAMMLVWSLLDPDARPSFGILLRVIALFAGPFLLHSAMPGVWRATTTTGPEHDVLIGFDARVTQLDPFQVEARGTVWRARFVGVGAVLPGATVRVVGREGLTLLVQHES